MKIDIKLLESISQLAAIRLNQTEKTTLLESINSLIEDFSCLNDFQVEDGQKTTFPISMRKDIIVPCTNIDTLHLNFPHKIDHLLVAPLINHEENME
jgi:aspartyl/glutamyl-tRNA(Asn/Gln) amidotransferase C subunit